MEGFEIKLIKLLYILFGFLFMGLGMLGVILPLLPTTPLLLLALFFFVKGSEQFEIWFKETNLYKKHLEGFVREKAMTLKQKITINLFADVMIAIPFIILDNLWIRLLLLGVVGYKYYYFFTKIKTRPSK
nr:YbaN family protein [Mesobacillus maritimus]